MFTISSSLVGARTIRRDNFDYIRRVFIIFGYIFVTNKTPVGQLSETVGNFSAGELGKVIIRDQNNYIATPIFEKFMPRHMCRD